MHPAARVFDDDFEAFVMWATESQTVEIRGEGDGHDENAPIDVVSRIEPALRRTPPPPEPPTATQTPIVRATPVVAPSVVTPTVVPPPADSTAARCQSPDRPHDRREPSRIGTSPAGRPAAQPENAAPPAEKFWDDGRTTRSTRAERPTRAERDPTNRISTLPSTLLLQAGAMIVIVAILVLKLG